MPWTTPPSEPNPDLPKLDPENPTDRPPDNRMWQMRPIDCATRWDLISVFAREALPPEPAEIWPGTTRVSATPTERRRMRSCCASKRDWSNLSRKVSASRNFCARRLRVVSGAMEAADIGRFAVGAAVAQNGEAALQVAVPKRLVPKWLRAPTWRMRLQGVGESDPFAFGPKPARKPRP